MNVRNILQSERPTLRLLCPDDATEFARLLGNDREAVLMTSHIPERCTEEAARGWIAMRTRPGEHAFAIIRRSGMAFLGAIGIGGPREMTGVGYWIGRSYWGQGYATEALRLGIDFARSLGAKGLEAETFPGNPASDRVREKCGFVRRGVAQRDYPACGDIRDVHVYRLDFEGRSIPDTYSELTA